MRKVFTLFAILTSFAASAQSIGINADGSAANSSAMLDVKSTTKGFLPPRMTSEQMLLIPSPAQGLLAFCTNCGTTANGEYYFFKGTAWVLLSSTTVSSFTSVGGVSGTATPNGATVTTDGVLNLAPADGDNPGIVTANAQTFKGIKTFSSGIVGNVTGNAATVTTNANLTGDVTSNGNAATVVKINGTSLSGLATGILKNTTATGVPTIATAGTDYQLPITLTTTGSGAATLSSNTLNIPNVSYTLPTATSSTLGGVMPDGTSILNEAGVLRVTPLSIGAQAAGSYVPYTGATGAVNLGTYDLTVNGLTVGKGAAGISTNTAVGINALSLSTTTGTDNTANGSNALKSNTLGKENTANGSNALQANIQGSGNTANGYQALYTNQGSNNTAFGQEALYSNNNGNGNAAFGNFALRTNTTGTFNTAIGTFAGVQFGNLSNTTAIGNGAIVNASNTIQLGNGAVTAVQLGTGTNVTLETGLVKITGGTPGAGKVLTSDAAGLASWATPSSGVDLATAQTIAGAKTFTTAPVLSTATASQALFTDANKNIVSNAITGTGDVVMSASPILTGKITAENQTLSGTLGVGTNSPAASAILDITSTTKGFLPPRMTTIERNAISPKVAGLMIYCTDCVTNGEPQYCNGSAWVSMSNGYSVPSAPVITSVTPGNGQAVIAFTAPSNNGGMAITAYTATSSPGGFTGTVSQAGGGNLTVGNLINGTPYTFTVTATNAIGTSVASTASSSVIPSTCGTISDIDGNAYNTVLIGAQCWTRENLRVTKYNDGTAIPLDDTGGSGGSSSTWQNLTTGARAVYANDFLSTPSNLTKYGYLYNWYAAKGIITAGGTSTKNICPSGWHVPTDAEWTTLTTDIGGGSVAGGKMKSIGTAYWNSPNTGATNETGFSALPGGYRYGSGSFIDIRNGAFFWSATETGSFTAWTRYLYSSNGSVYRYIDGKSLGASVRCLRD